MMNGGGATVEVWDRMPRGPYPFSGLQPSQPFTIEGNLFGRIPINFSHLTPAHPETPGGRVTQAFNDGNYKSGFAQIKAQVEKAAADKAAADKIQTMVREDQVMVAVTGTIANWASIAADTTKLFGDALRITHLSKTSVAIGNVLTPISVGIEALQVYKGEVEFGAFLVNTAIVGIGIIGGPAGTIGAAAWYLADPMTVNNHGCHNPSQDDQPFYVNGKKYVRCY